MFQYLISVLSQFFIKFGDIIFLVVKGLKRTEKNVPFFLKEQKRTQRMERSFEKNRCPTLPVLDNKYYEKDSTRNVYNRLVVWALLLTI